MNGSPDLSFDFTFDGEEREAILAEAKKTVGALRSELSDTVPGAPDAAEEAALRLLEEIDQAVARFSAYPDVIALEEKHFTAHGLTVPPRFRDLRRQARFYWLRFPVVLKPAAGTAFSKLQCAVEFNPGVLEGHLRPRAALILPDRKFQQALQFGGGLDVRIGESFEFEVDTGKLEAGGGGASATGQGKADVKLAGQLGLVAGPFTYTLKKAVIDHTAPGAEKVFWTLTGTEFIQGDDPTFVVVLQVPDGVEEVKIAAALQAYHGFDLGGGTLGEALRYLRQRVAAFFRAGAPTRDPKVWDITPNLQ